MNNPSEYQLINARLRLVSAGNKLRLDQEIWLDKVVLFDRVAAKPVEQWTQQEYDILDALER